MSTYFWYGVCSYLWSYILWVAHISTKISNGKQIRPVVLLWQRYCGRIDAAGTDPNPSCHPNGPHRPQRGLGSASTRLHSVSQLSSSLFPMSRFSPSHRSCRPSTTSFRSGPRGPWGGEGGRKGGASVSGEGGVVWTPFPANHQNFVDLETRRVFLKNWPKLRTPKFDIFPRCEPRQKPRSLNTGGRAGPTHSEPSYRPGFVRACACGISLSHSQGTAEPPS